MQAIPGRFVFVNETLHFIPRSNESFPSKEWWCQLAIRGIQIESEYCSTLIDT